MHDAGSTEMGRLFRCSKVLDRKLNHLEAQMVFSLLLTVGTLEGIEKSWMWTLGYADGDGEMVWPTVLNSRLMDSYPQKNEKEEEKKEEEGKNRQRKYNLIHKYENNVY